MSHIPQVNWVLALSVLAELEQDKEFALRLHGPYVKGSGQLVASYLQDRGVSQREAIALSLAYSLGVVAALEWTSRAIDRAERAAADDPNG